MNQQKPSSESKPIQLQKTIINQQSQQKQQTSVLPPPPPIDIREDIDLFATNQLNTLRNRQNQMEIENDQQQNTVNEQMEIVNLDD